MRPHFAAALIVDERGRYLMQIRDRSPGILHPGALGLFGGAVEPGESAEQAIRRELAEEIGIVPEDLAFWRTLQVPLPAAGRGMRDARVGVFTATIAAARVPFLDQQEGAGRTLIGPRRLLAEAAVATSARLAVALHARAAIAAALEEPAAERWLVPAAVSDGGTAA
ncbi:NUDIX domain-containing protein [Elioraea sp. Yellowstone]|uniref:NUDIX domain-containing protein n=1 Tax=Elioraea sp. Yellowstone TaxID=2592070 RepID=UPI00192A5A15|nr:NUDIX domain-containing protein [Elioraea sp. Yellowstone]